MGSGTPKSSRGEGLLLPATTPPPQRARGGRSGGVFSTSKAKGAGKGRRAAATTTLLWLATALAVVGILRLDSAWRLTRLSAWVPRTGAAPPTPTAPGAVAPPTVSGAPSAEAAADAAAAAALAELHRQDRAQQQQHKQPAAVKATAAAAASGKGDEGDAAAAIPRGALLLATHGRLMWYDPATDRTLVLHEGEGVHYGMFPGEGSPPRTVWTAIRPHNWRPATEKEYLVELNMATGAELHRVEIPARFTHDIARRGDRVYVCDTGNGRILEYEFPSMSLKRALPLFTLKDHANTLAPYRENELLVVLHNLGSSDVVRVDGARDPASVIGRLQGVGTKAHGLVRWRGGYLTLDSDGGALAHVRVAGGAARVTKLWQAPESGRFLKGLAVVDDVAYFGVSEWAPRSARDDPKRDCELAAFDLEAGRLLWRRQVPTAGLLNSVGAPQLAEDSTYAATYSGAPLAPPRRDPRSDARAAAALAELEGLGYPARVGGYWSSGVPYLDAAAKATPTPWTAGLQLPLMGLDITAARAALAALPAEAWEHEWQAKHSAVMAGRDANMAAFKPGVKGITLLFSAGSGEGPVYEFPMWRALAPAIAPLVEEMVGAPDMANVIRAQLALMRPNASDIRIHVDTGGYATYAHRLHIPLRTNPGVSFDLCPFKDEAKTRQACYKVPTPEGLAFELNNKVPHRVSNKGNEDRVHLVVDVAETPRRRVALEPGTECHYDVNRGLFCGAAAAVQQQMQQQQVQQQQMQQQQQVQMQQPPLTAPMTGEQLLELARRHQASLEADAAAARAAAGADGVSLLTHRAA